MTEVEFASAKNSSENIRDSPMRLWKPAWCSQISYSDVGLRLREELTS